VGVSYDEAERLLHEWTPGTPLRNHARAVEAVMRMAAHRYGRGPEDETTWAIAGLLHDADYEQWPDEHPRRVIAWLQEHGEPAIAHAVSAHHTGWNVPYETQLDRALLACDELTGFVVACCLVRPDGVHGLKPSSVKKKLKDRSFAAKVDRNEVRAGVELLGADLDEHIQLVIDALTPHAAALGINGSGAGAGPEPGPGG
jgi:predicted hydrolase (HD superfamily)